MSGLGTIEGNHGIQREMQIGGKTLSLETGALARQAHGACVIRYGDTVVIATATWKEGNVIGDFMPLTVDYKEYTYAGGRIPGGFFKREGRPTEKEILTSRLIDRPLRPSFQEGLPERDADHRARAVGRRRERPRRAGDQRRVDRARHLRDPVHESDRRRARRLHRQARSSSIRRTRSATSPTSTSSWPAPTTRS